MHILLSNDDGIHAAGIQCLRTALQNSTHQITTVAPDRNRSGMSQAMTLRRPLYPLTIGEDAIQVDGTPIDCVHLALTGYLKEKPDCVIAGINHGPNLGNDVFYSGTVAAAMGGRDLLYPALAISLAGTKHFASAAQVACELLSWSMQSSLARGTILNINIPDLPYSALRGVQVTRLGRRAAGQQLDAEIHPRAEGGLWIGANGAPLECGEGTDFYAVRQGYVSLTPLSTDMTDHARVLSLRDHPPRIRADGSTSS